MLQPVDYHPGSLSFKFKTIKNKKAKSKSAKKDDETNKFDKDAKIDNSIENRELTLEEKEEIVASEMTTAELKFQKNRINYLKNSWEATKGKTYKDLIEEQNEKLAKIPLHYDLEGK